MIGADAPPLVYLGAALPDLWPHLSTRPLPKLILDRLRAGDDAEGHRLAHGIAHHMQADAVFHRHPIFSERVERVSDRLCGLLGEPRWATVCAHVLVEMLLDRWLIERDTGFLDRYYAHFDDTNRERAAALASHRADMQQELAQLLAYFVELRFLADYTRAEGLAYRLVRTLRRVSDSIVPEARMEALAALVSELHVELAPDSDRLLAEVAQAVDQRLPPLAARPLELAS